MLKVRVIPTLLYKDVGLVKGICFNSWRRVDTVLPAIKVYNMREVDELILVDIAASDEGREPDYEMIKDFSRECFVPFCVGGGIRRIDQVKNLLRSGADKVTINTAAYDNNDENSVELIDTFDSKTVEDPLETIMKEEYYNEIQNAVNKSLSKFEKQVLDRFIKGESYVTIAKRLDSPVKSVDNAIQRIRKKAIKNMFNND